MAFLRLRNGVVVCTSPTGTVVGGPDMVEYCGGEVPTTMFTVTDIYFKAEPATVDDYLTWRGGPHGDGFDVVEILSEEESKQYLKDHD